MKTAVRVEGLVGVEDPLDSQLFHSAQKPLESKFLEENDARVQSFNIDTFLIFVIRPRYLRFLIGEHVPKHNAANDDCT